MANCNQGDPFFFNEVMKDLDGSPLHDGVVKDLGGSHKGMISPLLDGYLNHRRIHHLVGTDDDQLDGV